MNFQTSEIFSHENRQVNNVSQTTIITSCRTIYLGISFLRNIALNKFCLKTQNSIVFFHTKKKKNCEIYKFFSVTKIVPKLFIHLLSHILEEYVQTVPIYFKAFFDLQSLKLKMDNYYTRLHNFSEHTHHIHILQKGLHFVEICMLGHDVMPPGITEGQFLLKNKFVLIIVKCINIQYL